MTLRVWWMKAVVWIRGVKTLQWWYNPVCVCVSVNADIAFLHIYLHIVQVLHGYYIVYVLGNKADAIMIMWSSFYFLIIVIQGTAIRPYLIEMWYADARDKIIYIRGHICLQQRQLELIGMALKHCLATAWNSVSKTPFHFPWGKCMMHEAWLFFPF